MDNNIQKFKIMSFSPKDLPNYGEVYLVEATSSDNDYVHEFRLAKTSSLVEEARQAYEEDELWLVDMSKFQNKDDIPDVNGCIGIRTIHDELVTIDEDDLKAMLDKAIRKSVLAQMGFAGLDELKTYTAKVITMKDGYVYANHDLDNVTAENEEDAYNVMLSVVSRREGRLVSPSDILSCIILPNGDKLFNFDKN